MRLNIKSLFFSLLAFAGVSCFFTGCSDQWAGHRGSSFNENQQQDYVIYDTINSTVEVADIDPTKSRLVYDTRDDVYNGLFDSSQPFDTNEYYFRINKDNGTKYGVNLTGKVDINAQQTVLCADLRCAHNSKNCLAYISMTGDYFTIDGKLYFYSPYVYEYGDDLWDGEGKRIRLLSIDENGKKLVAEVQGYTQEHGSVVTDGTNIYFTAQRWNSTDTCIMKLNVHTGDCVVMYTFPAKWGYQDYRISDITADGNQAIFTAHDGNNFNRYVVGVCSFTDKSCTITNQLFYDDFMNRDTGKNKSDCTISGNYIYIIDGTTGRMTKQRIGSTETQVLFENIKDVVGDTNCVLMSYVYGDKMALTRTGKYGPYLGSSKDFVLDTNTLEIIPLDFKGRDSGYVQYLVRLYSATPDYFVIATHTTNNNALANEVVFILKDDFYANNINTIPVGVIKFY